jgi:hypothetical protein
MGTDLNAVKKVTFEGDELRFEAAKDGTSLMIFVTRKVTSKSGIVELLGASEDGKLMRAELQIGSPPAKPETPAK